MGILIDRLDAGWVLDSRAVPTVEATVVLSDGRSVVARAPSGASTGSHESMERRDGKRSRFAGKGVDGAVSSVQGEICTRLSGADPTDQEAIDRAMVELDGTEQRTRLGANALVAVSAACARAGALVRGVPLWQHLAAGGPPSLPLPMVNMISGNLHAHGGMGIQDVLAVPVGASSYEEALVWIVDVYHSLGELLEERGASTLVGDEGGFGAPTSSSEAAISLVTEAVDRAGRDPGHGVALALDVAATHLLDVDGRYHLDGATLSGTELTDMVCEWVDRYPVISVEDPLGEDAWGDWASLGARVAPVVQLIGDDLLCTRRSRVDRAAETGAANAVLVKPNQIGTLSEALGVVRRASELSMAAVPSARSGETEDDWLADFAVASGAGQIKVGSVARSERLAKYNRLLRIAREPDAPPWAGTDGLAPIGRQR